MKAYASMIGVFQVNLYFSFDGDRVLQTDTDTANTLELEDGMVTSQIDVGLNKCGC
jgi:hypothetical protein